MRLSIQGDQELRRGFEVMVKISKNEEEAPRTPSPHEILSSLASSPRPTTFGNELGSAKRDSRERSSVVRQASCSFLSAGGPWVAGGLPLMGDLASPGVESMSFAHALASSLCPMKIDLILKPPAFTNDGLPAVYFSKEEFRKSEQPLKLAIVAKCSYGRPSIPDITSCLSQRLALKGDCIVSSLNPRHILLRFFDEEDFLKVLVGFPNLPINLYNEDYLKCIAGNFGEVLRIHDSTLAWTQTAEALVCVNVDIAKPLADRIWIGNGDKGFWQVVTFHRVPPICKVCRRLGHTSDSCKKKSREKPLLQQVHPPPPVNQDQEWRVVKRKSTALDKQCVLQTNTVPVSNVFDRLADDVLDPDTAPSGHGDLHACTHVHETGDPSWSKQFTSTVGNSSAEGPAFAQDTTSAVPLVPEVSRVVHVPPGDATLQTSVDSLHGSPNAVHGSSRRRVLQDSPAGVSPEGAPEEQSGDLSPAGDGLPNLGFGKESKKSGVNIIVDLRGKPCHSKALAIPSFDPANGALCANASSLAFCDNILLPSVKISKDGVLPPQHGNVFGKIESVVLQAESHVAAMQIRFDGDPSEANRASLNAANADLRRALTCQETFWAQKSRLNWFKDGDKNTSFYHAVVQGNRRRALIHRLKVDGVWCEDQSKLAMEADSFFHRLLTSEDHNSRWIIGDGRKVDFLNHVWLGQGPLSDLLSSPYSGPPLTVREVIRDVNHPARLLVTCHELLQNVKLQPQDDCCVWTASSNGAFTTSSAYNILSQYGVKRHALHRLWHHTFYRRASFFCWKLLYRAIPVDSRVSDLGVPLASRCSCCASTSSEDLNHLFINSDLARILWGWIAPILVLNVATYDNITTRLWTLLRQCNTSSPSGFVSLYASILILWEIWRARCSMMFESKRPSVSRITHHIHYLVSSSLGQQEFTSFRHDPHLKALQYIGLFPSFKYTSIKIFRWKPPDYGLVLHVDGASKGNPGLCGGGGCIRDSSGNFLFAFAHSYGIGGSLMVEVRALYDGLQLAFEFGFVLTTICFDSQILVNSLRSGKPPSWDCMHWWRAACSLFNAAKSRAFHVYRHLNQVADALANMTKFITIKANEIISYLVPTLAFVHLLESPFHVWRLTMRRRRYFLAALGMISILLFLCLFLSKNFHDVNLTEFLFAASLTNVNFILYSFFLSLTEARLDRMGGWIRSRRGG
ncbi:hypothetical protein Taro_000888 [Colocasia esculenta]|uniref:RNase H type-1 domain-containing protein n=1 Tax=Colocasia esculenta TaxID=4460 RepID=A0A843THN4_COLES|nr:hypothetical protein [Colocasia esculenta]